MHIGRYGISAALGCALIALVPAIAREAPPIAGMTQMFDGAMRPDVAVETFSHSDRLLPTHTVHRAGPVADLPRNADPFPAIRFEDKGHIYDLNDYLAMNRVAGLLVLKDGKIVLEDYELGAGPETRWISFSMAKSVTSTLVGAAIRDGYIKSVDDPVTRYVPELKGSAYDGARVRDVLMMASGVQWDETYTDPTSDRRKLLAQQLTQKPGVVLRYMAGLPRAAKPGTRWNYNTGETFVLGAVVEGAVKKPLADYLSEKIWSKTGMESDATWWLESVGGAGFGGSGIGATLRDYGRFALFAANGGRIGDNAVLPDNWFSQAGMPHSIEGETVDYGYMWWIPRQADPINEGAFEAIGIFGQYMYINPRERLAIVVLSARSKPAATSTWLSDDAFFSAVAHALH
jgi:CubicO group peptidase (beta-lactamase class C family)